MKKQDLIKAVSFLSDPSKVGGELFFHYVEADKEELLKAPTDATKLNKKLAAIYSESVTTTFKNENDYEIKNIMDVQEFDINTTYYYYEENYPEKLIVLTEQANGTFDFSTHKYNFIKGFVIKLTYGKNSVLLYKIKSNLDFRVTKHWITMVKVSSGFFTSPSNESLVLNEKFEDRKSVV